ncbi:1-deoxy-D-xylulose-5-phosphate synthase [Spiroplasma corruscae]|uniref:1-deoxy-D-xylulose-5-phosphate synthase n=1 Tax=Spiroplasma corruscae TaxID=216934 RepID=A0A222EPQ3_9MOLU|nr:1-deoxy-D-xylulose-5-phosphate synthase N-terminal domain-containing protein [Spiroplasma corruscae]ASP28254.1 1-deoxy-D-xylulose-5-phosphate synthase [Spiroplasma corruscae]
MLDDEIGYKNLYKNKNLKELEKFASVIREYLSNFIQKKNGHIGSNLGVVELTIAFFVFFNIDDSMILFDTGHQSHVFKLLVNGYKKFETLKDKNGLSNFQEFKESDLDWISSGHSSTALAYAVGYGIINVKKNIVVTIGDAAFFTSYSHGALLNLGKSKSKVIIFLNDNEESIGTETPRLNSIDSYCKSLGINYIFCENGNNFTNIFDCLNKVETIKNHVLIHFKTKKALGYTGNKPLIFNHSVEEVKNKSYTVAISEEITNYFTNDDYLLSASMLKPSNFHHLKEKFYNNVIDMGINEETIVLTANAISNTNKKVFVSIYSTFLQRCVDQLIHDVARNNNPVGFLIDRGGLSYSGGVSHHGIYDISIASNIQNSVICNPYDENDVKQLTKLLYENTNKVFFLRYENKELPISKQIKKIKIGEWDYLIYNKNNKKVLMAYGNILKDFKDYILKNNLNINLVNARFIKPFDIKILEQNRYNNIYVYEEVYETGSLYEKIIAYFKNKENIYNFNLKSNNVMHGSMKELLKEARLDIDYIFNFILKEG